MRASIVAPAPRSEAAAQKDQSKRTAEGHPVHSLRTLLLDLGTLAKNVIRLKGTETEFCQLTEPTDLQREVFQRLGLRL